MTPSDVIPVTRLDNAEVWDAVHPRLRDLVLRGSFTLGPELAEFETQAALAFGCPWAVGTSSGTSALALALRASPLPAHSRVALPANTFYATLESVVLAGHVPVVVDHDEDYLIDLEQLADADVDAVVPVHLYGLPVDMPALMALANRRGWWVVEDCAQAHGATIDGAPVGSFGHAAAFSAYPTKNLGAWGDAGFVTGQDSLVRDRLTALRHHGQRTGNVHEEIGGTDRLDNLQALVLTEKLRRLPEEVARRRDVARRYREMLAGFPMPVPGDRDARLHAYHLFVVRVPDRHTARRVLAERGVDTAVHYPTPLHLQPGASGLAQVVGDLRRSEQWADQLLTLPLYPSLTDQEVARVADAVRAALTG